MKRYLVGFIDSAAEQELSDLYPIEASNPLEALEIAVDCGYAPLFDARYSCIIKLATNSNFSIRLDCGSFVF